MNDFETQRTILGLEATILELKLQRDNAIHFAEMKEAEIGNLKERLRGKCHYIGILEKEITRLQNLTEQVEVQKEN